MFKNWKNSGIMTVLGCTVDYANNYNPLATIDNGSCAFSNQSENALIVESSIPLIEGHGIYVQNEYIVGYPTGISTIRGNGISDGFQYADNTNLGALIYSYSGLPGLIANALTIYPTTQMFMPLGSNDPVLISNPSTIPVIITCGAGSTHNITGYGPGLEFWDDEQSGSIAIQSSLSNGKIAGKIMQIRQTLNCGFWEARFRARYTADRNETRRPANTLWTQEDGFGKINVAAAIALDASFFCMDPDSCVTIPVDPYINGGNVMAPFIA